MFNPLRAEYYLRDYMVKDDPVGYNNLLLSYHDKLERLQERLNALPDGPDREKTVTEMELLKSFFRTHPLLQAAR